MSVAKSHRVIPEPPFSPCLSAVDCLDKSVAASSNLRLQLFSPPECQEESCNECKRKKKIVKEGKTSISVNCCQILKGLKSALGKISGLCRLTKRLSLCAGSWPTSAGRRQPASKVRRWNISQDAHGRISGRSGPF